MNEFFTQVADFIGQRWGELLALVGGSAGIIAILTFLGRFLSSFVVAKISKKNYIPINKTIADLKDEIFALRDELKSIKEELPKTMAEATKQVIEIKNKAKRKAYAKIMEGKELVEEVIEETKPVIEEVKEIIQEQVEEVKKVADDTVKVVIKSE